MAKFVALLRAVLKANPFPDEPRAKVAVAFLDRPLRKGALDDLVVPGNEDVKPGKRVIYTHYPDGMGRSKLRLPAPLGAVTVRNVNTVGKLVEMMPG
jgi:uncharacterized protein (DUF1697 family)